MDGVGELSQLFFVVGTEEAAEPTQITRHRDKPLSGTVSYITDQKIEVSGGYPASDGMRVVDVLRITARKTIQPERIRERMCQIANGAGFWMVTRSRSEADFGLRL